MACKGMIGSARGGVLLLLADVDCYQVALPKEQCTAVMLRWCHELIDRKRNHQAIEVLLTLGEYHQVLQVYASATSHCSLP